MDLALQGKCVLITGGSKGIGLACALAFAAEGARVAVASRSVANLAAAKDTLAAAGTTATFIAADLTSSEAAIALADQAEREIGPIDVLVNSAGAAQRYALDELDMDAWHAAMEVKYFTYIHAMQAVFPGMKIRKRGAIVNIIGQGGKVPRTTHLAGGAANAALMLVSAGLAAALGEYGIRVNAINPGSILTDRSTLQHTKQAQLRGISLAEIEAEAARGIPLGRLGRPEEIANVALFLASDRASYVTSACITMDGGASPTVV